jgi:hypothetical protein
MAFAVRESRAREDMIMRGADKVACQAATMLLLLALTAAPAQAQFGGFGGVAGGEDMITRMAPMLELMKAKMGKRRFGMLMQTMGPMMSRMMDNGGFGAGIPGGFGGVSGYAPDAPAISGGYGGSDMIGGAGGGDIMAMIPQLMQLANVGGGHRRHRRR